MSVDQVVNFVDIAIHKLPYMESLYEQVKDQAEKMQRTIQRLVNDVGHWNVKYQYWIRLLSLLNKSAGENIKNYRNLLLKRYNRKVNCEYIEWRRLFNAKADRQRKCESCVIRK
jgi:hypothetical protein